MAVPSIHLSRKFQIKWRPAMPTGFIIKFTFVAKHLYFIFDFGFHWQNDEKENRRTFVIIKSDILPLYMY